MSRILSALALLAGLTLAGPAFAGATATSPPPPVPTLCGFGNSVTAMPGYGKPLTCGTALNTGTINVGSAPQLGQYVGAASTVLGPVTMSGDCTIATGGAITPPARQGKAGTPRGTPTPPRGRAGPPALPAPPP